MPQTHLPDIHRTYRVNVSSERQLPDFVLAIAQVGWSLMAPNWGERERQSVLPEREGGYISMISGAIVD